MSDPGFANASGRDASDTGSFAESEIAPYNFHPVDLGDVINGRYRILRLLGEGTFSMVWLAEDLRPPPGQPRLVSLKICVPSKHEHGEPSPEKAERASKDLEETQREDSVLRHIQYLKKSKPSTSESPSFYAEGGKFIVDIYDEFTVIGPNGTHRCIVMEFCGPSLLTVLNFLLCKGIPSRLGQRLAIQLAQAVAFLQGCNIAHGDLHSGNILLFSRRLRTWGVKDVKKRLGKPRYGPRGELPKRPHGPKRQSEPINQGIWMRVMGIDQEENLFSDIELRLADFGQAYISHPPAPPFYPGIPTSLAAPEVLVRKCIMHAADVPTEPDNGDLLAESPNGKAPARDVPAFRTLSDDQLMDPEHNPFLKAVGLPQDSELLTITPRADLWSLGGNLFGLFESRDSLFGSGSSSQEAEMILYELGLVFDVEDFLKIPEFHEYDPDRAPKNDPIAQRCRRSLLVFQPYGLWQTIESLMQIKPGDRCDAIKAVEMLQKTWPEVMETVEPLETVEETGHEERPNPSVFSRIWAFITLGWLFSWVSSLYRGLNESESGSVFRIRGRVRSIFGIRKGGVNHAAPDVGSPDLENGQQRQEAGETTSGVSGGPKTG